MVVVYTTSKKKKSLYLYIALVVVRREIRKPCHCHVTTRYDHYSEEQIRKCLWPFFFFFMSLLIGEEGYADQGMNWSSSICKWYMNWIGKKVSILSCSVGIFSVQSSILKNQWRKKPWGNRHFQESFWLVQRETVHIQFQTTYYK